MKRPTYSWYSKTGALRCTELHTTWTTAHSKNLEVSVHYHSSAPTEILKTQEALSVGGGLFVTLVGIVPQIGESSTTPWTCRRGAPATWTCADDGPPRLNERRDFAAGDRSTPHNIGNSRERLDPSSLLSGKRCAGHRKRELLYIMPQCLQILVAQMPLDSHEITRLLVHLGSRACAHAGGSEPVCGRHRQTEYRANVQPPPLRKGRGRCARDGGVSLLSLRGPTPGTRLWQDRRS